jgi:hypothetical protein
MKELSEVSKFFDGGKLINRTHNNCQPLKILSLYNEFAP